MLLITLTNIKNLNTSLQIGDAIYVTTTTPLLDGVNEKGADINSNDNMVGFLRKIDDTLGAVGTYVLHVDNANSPATVVNVDDFIMFSKYNQSDSDIKGYYMQVRLVNNSNEKAELFSISSEVTESSR